ncbi:flagellar motor protein MotA [Rhizobium sp. CECT 9324]|jgi:hypothetical protein|uniref:flagellar motor protein MotA n=1 Tax=Rhizobium sp. CECT 9324 TaxID=2845820 RepID=UPI001E53E349|nr:flagellar motor protein MotA [Rhizobium sp. CECT 9324]CAH0341735.1 hypothetical protein RHI9324_03437 [Rhizobium sp. CECT 9324]
MAKVKLADLEVDETRAGEYGQKLSSPMPFFTTMVIFLIIVGFIAAILYRQAHAAFITNPGLNGLILGVMAVGIILVFNQVLALRPEVRWFNSFRAAGNDFDRVGRDPRLLAPMKSLIGGRRSMAISTTALRSILDSIGTRLDESRDTTRYLVGLLVFLGLLGTFWGLLGTIASINDVIQSLDPSSGDSNDVLTALKSGLTAPLAGMGTAFSSSLLGLSGSLILGFLDLQAGRAQNRFYTELENWLSSVTDLDSELAVVSDGSGAVASEDVKLLLVEVARLANRDGGDNTSSERSVAAIAGLAEGIQGLVKNMRNEQQMLRDWIEAQQEDARAMRKTLDRLNDKIGGTK